MIGTYFCFNDVPSFTETGCEYLPHFFPAGKILLSEQFELLVVPVVDVSTLDQSLMSFTAGVCRLVREVSTGDWLPVEARCTGA